MERYRYVYSNGAVRWRRVRDVTREQGTEAAGGPGDTELHVGGGFPYVSLERAERVPRD